MQMVTFYIKKSQSIHNFHFYNLKGSTTKVLLKLATFTNETGAETFVLREVYSNPSSLSDCRHHFSATTVSCQLYSVSIPLI